MTLVDANILLDLLTDDPAWAPWSIAALDKATVRGPLFINDVIYAEVSARFERIETLEAFLDDVRMTLAPMPRHALFLAAKTFNRYRKAGGTRTGVLPDFFIGAHAAVLDIPLLTRDVGRYRTYFPTVSLFTPD